MSTVSAPPAQHEHHVQTSDGPPRSVWIRPGWWRALLWTWVAAGLGIVLPAGIRELLGWDWYSRPVTFTTVLFLAPIGFILGIGCFDYWFRYVVGAPTQPEDHDDHGAYRWQDYFKVNTDHKVIGDPVPGHDVRLLPDRRPLREAFRTELAKPGLQFFTRRAVQRPDLGARRADDLPLHHPGVRRARELRDPADARRRRHGVPAPERAQLLDAADRGRDDGRRASFWQGFGAGWTAYAPLASDYQTVSQLFFNIGVQFAGFSSIFTALNFLVTILTMRAPGMTLWRMPLLVWANLTTSTLVVLGTPFIAGSQFMLLFDHVMHTDFFNYRGGGYVLLYQHIFWFYSHPAVYIMMLPGFGIVSEVISVMARKPIFGYRAVAFSTIAIVRARLHGLGPPHVRRPACRPGCASRS